MSYPRDADPIEELLAASERAAELRAEGFLEKPRGRTQAVNRVRRVEALGLRMAGLSLDQIAERMGIEDLAVEALIDSHLAETRNPLVEERRELENMRLDRAQAAIWPSVLRGELPAVRVFLQISARRATMNGIDKPKRLELSGNIRIEMEQALSDLHEVVLGEVVDVGPGADPEDHRAIEAGGEPGIL